MIDGHIFPLNKQTWIPFRVRLDISIDGPAQGRVGLVDCHLTLIVCIPHFMQHKQGIVVGPGHSRPPSFPSDLIVPRSENQAKIQGFL
jgi:hypothetical protein